MFNLLKRALQYLFDKYDDIDFGDVHVRMAIVELDDFFTRWFDFFKTELADPRKVKFPEEICAVPGGEIQTPRGLRISLQRFGGFRCMDFRKQTTRYAVKHALELEQVVDIIIYESNYSGPELRIYEGHISEAGLNHISMFMNKLYGLRMLSYNIYGRLEEERKALFAGSPPMDDSQYRAKLASVHDRAAELVKLIKAVANRMFPE